ncbi:enoyl-CoA hydratase/isomerase family protein [Chloroflexota bacterium]
MSEIIYEKKGRIAYITLNRPETRNAYNYAMVQQWVEALEDFRDDPETWACITTGNGPAFCAGADLKELSNPETRDRLMSFLTDKAPCLVNNDIWKPTICALDGPALGGGCEFALSCDIRIFTENARIGLTEARVGMGANFGTHKLARMIPLGVALESLFTGDLLSAEEAYSWGLANQVVPPGELMLAADKMAERILSCAPLSIRRMKENAMKGLELPLMYAIRLNLGPNVYKSEDQLEGARAFAEKRKPVWQGK